jgi:hypothetical protein
MPLRRPRRAGFRRPPGDDGPARPEARRWRGGALPIRADAVADLGAGGPAPNATFYCSTTSPWCYLYVSTTAAYGAAVTACTGRGMQLVTFDTAAEQREAEYSLVPASTDYYVGLSYATSQWAWQDGTVLGDGIVPSNAAPYAHWAQAANTTFSSNPTYTAVRAQASSAYGPYTGDGSLAQQVASYYTTAAANKTGGWLPTLPTAAHAYMCRGSKAVMFACPPSPPTANPPPPLISSSLCEWARWEEGAAEQRPL